MSEKLVASTQQAARFWEPACCVETTSFCDMPSEAQIEFYNTSRDIRSSPQVSLRSWEHVRKAGRLYTAGSQCSPVSSWEDVREAGSLLCRDYQILWHIQGYQKLTSDQFEILRACQKSSQLLHSQIWDSCSGALKLKLNRIRLTISWGRFLAKPLEIEQKV